MPLTLTWKGPIGRPIEGGALRPDTLAGTADEIARLRIPAGNASVDLGELFILQGDGRDGHLIFEGDLRPIRGLAAGMASGRVEVRGDVGPRLGVGMSGGSIEVGGSAGAWAGAEMTGGSIRIRGDAGDFLGSALPGSRLGMRDGMILVDGRAGDDVGLAMRRGLIAVGGMLGEGAGRGMVAGSIFGFQGAGRGLGAGMKRGTIALFCEDGPELLPTFEPSGAYRPPFLTIYLRRIAERGFPVPEAAFAAPIRRYNGDRIERGQGEVLLASLGG